ncbi:TadE/TadG family type IV pilus assembly protein [Desulfohalovibrio reitneri]|uniref:TadE/TadG family type IV pilus assembly protein n=1 Tax=Desulfohalovibrio reitneri TaxID=1307759 RepID=UPI000A6EA979|nr:TadE family protein [Desulfohalovibrio reitneri]
MRAFRSEKGSVSVEFALTMAFLVFPLFIGTIDVSRLVGAKTALTRAAREGAVAASRAM